MSEVTFRINGKPYSVSSLSPDTSLSIFLRQHANLRGTKVSCQEGGCGACIVAACVIHPVTGIHETFSVNSCLVSILSCHDWDITTIEGVGNKLEGYHPIQKRLASFNGTQCGFCSPGFVMSMFCLKEKKAHCLSTAEVENSFGSNICRCTGYRPIADAFKTFAQDCSPELLSKVHDIEDLSSLTMCKKSGSICTKTYDDYVKDEDFCMINADISLNVFKEHIELKSPETKWFKAYTIQRIFEIFDSEGTDSYQLVAGNTAQGVVCLKERRLPRVMIDIASVAELRQHSMEANFVLGANMTITELMELLLKTAKEDDYFFYGLKLNLHLDKLAHIPVRNIGTIAGNLSIKHQHNDFPSDLFLLFETIGATIRIVERNGVSKILTLPEYLEENMEGKIIHSIFLPPLSSEYQLESYKIMLRAQNSHAIVNAGFLFKINSQNIIQNATIVYGGIHPQFIHATKTENFLKGKNVFTDQVFQLAVKVLKDEINPNHNAPEPGPEYRKKLAIGLFYKCILHMSPPDSVKPFYESGGKELCRPVSHGKQEFETNKELWPVNKPMPKLEALMQCTGEAMYCDDIPTQPFEVFAAFVLSTVYNGEIDKIDGSEALCMKGVVALLTAKDIPGKNNFTPPFTIYLTEVEEVISSGKIVFHGQPVAIIVAENEKLAQKAAFKVKVTYKNSNAKMPYITNRSVMKTPSEKGRIQNVSTVQPTDTGNDTKNVIKGSLDLYDQYHFHLETQSCVCIPTENVLEVYTSSHWTDWVQVAISAALNIPAHLIDIQVRRLGGSFGSKITRCIQTAVACALVAHKLQRPTRFLQTIETNMITCGKRLPFSCDYEVGVNEQGKIQYLRNVFYQNCGHSMNESAIYLYALDGFRNCYDDSRWFVSANSVRTDLPSHTWFRGPGTTEGIAMIENIMEHIATELRQDSVTVRLNNMSVNDNPLPGLIETFKNSTNFNARSEDIKNFNSKNRWKKRGISLIPMRFGLLNDGKSSAFLSIYHKDGTVAVTHGGIEMGQGINTKVAQVCAYTLGIPLEMVTVKPMIGFVTPNTIFTGGSITSDNCCLATINACKIILARLEPIKKRMNNPSWPELIEAAFMDDVNLSAHYYLEKSDIQVYSVWGLTVTEVEVDMITGNHQVVRADILEDTGVSLSPEVDVGQIEGAFIMGMGHWTCEKIVYDDSNGELLTYRTWTYKTPGIKDIPIDFRIQFFHNAPNPIGVLRSKTTGEPAFTMGFGVVLALRQAITSARHDNGLPTDIWYNLDLPLTPESIFMATQTDVDCFKLK